MRSWILVRIRIHDPAPGSETLAEELKCKQFSLLVLNASSVLDQDPVGSVQNIENYDTFDADETETTI